MQLYFSYPVRNTGLFKARYDLIAQLKAAYAHDPQFIFKDTLPDIAQVHAYFQLLAKNTYSKEYLGELLTTDDPWKCVGAIADLDTIYTVLNNCITSNLKKAYIMTNTAGHHADNAHYELFCPINQLFFAVEYLNYHANFPAISWIDVDAHFGNGDKYLFDKYTQKMQSETNNLSGFSIQNDYASVTTTGYKAIQYTYDTTNEEYLSVLNENLSINDSTKYLLVFFGTDIIAGDYGSNKKITKEIIPEIVSTIETKAPNNAHILYIQAGGAATDNITTLISSLRTL